MPLPTIAHLRGTMPRLSQAAAIAHVPLLQHACAEFHINTGARVAAFLAQLAHESGELRWWEEIWGPTPAQLAYEPPSAKAKQLGNTRPGDGRRYKGHGPIQITGRANHRDAGLALGVDLESDPDLATKPEHGFRIAGWFWHTRGLNELADSETPEAFRAITRKINGGLTHLGERERYHRQARRAMGLAESTDRP
jgi:putative chitinase